MDWALPTFATKLCNVTLYRPYPDKTSSLLASGLAGKSVCAMTYCILCCGMYKKLCHKCEILHFKRLAIGE